MTSASFREDGRRSRELRHIVINKGIIDSYGYIDLHQGNTVVTAVCNGPRDKGKLCVKVSFSSVSRHEQVNDKQIAEYESTLVEIFTSLILHDEQIDIELVVKQDDGSLVSVMINCISLCLAYSGVSMLDMCCAVTLNDGCADLSSCEEGSRGPVLTLGYLFNRQKVAYLNMTGKCLNQTFVRMSMEAIEYCNTIYHEMKSFLVKQC